MRSGSSETKCECSQHKRAGKHRATKAGSDETGCCILRGVKKQSNKTNSDSAFLHNILYSRKIHSIKYHMTNKINKNIKNK